MSAQLIAEAPGEIVQAAMITVPLTIAHRRDAGYTVSDAAALIAALCADGYQVEERSDHWDIMALIHITATAIAGLNPRPIFVGEIYPGGRLLCLDNTVDCRFTRWLYLRLAGCAGGEGCDVCRWCRRMEGEDARA